MFEGPNPIVTGGQWMRHILVILTLLFLIGCVSTGASITVGTGGGFISISARGDLLETSPGEAFSINKQGVSSFLAKDYAGAQYSFETTLARYPGNPDATYYLGLTLIHLGQRDAGYTHLLKFRDPNHIRVTQNVQWWAAYCQKKPELTPEKITDVMNKARKDGWQKERQEAREERRW